jgi:hypothetical protein
MRENGVLVYSMSERVRVSGKREAFSTGWQHEQGCQSMAQYHASCVFFKGIISTGFDECSLPCA